MRKFFIVLIVLVATAFPVFADFTSTPTVTPTMTKTRTPTRTPTSTRTSTPTPTPNTAQNLRAIRDMSYTNLSIITSADTNYSLSDVYVGGYRIGTGSCVTLYDWADVRQYYIDYIETNTSTVFFNLPLYFKDGIKIRYREGAAPLYLYSNIHYLTITPTPTPAP